MQFIFLIQARLGSTRYPGKTLTHIRPGVTLIESVYDRVLRAKEATRHNIYVLTSESSQDDSLVAFMAERNISHFRGSEHDVFNRFYDFLIHHPSRPDYVIRVCCDNPFLDPEFINQITDTITLRNSEDIDYVSHRDILGRCSMATHYGFFCEAISYKAFIKAKNLELSDAEKEHVTPHFYKSGKFSTFFIPMPEEIQEKDYRFTFDTEKDLHVIRSIVSHLPNNFSYKDVIAIAQKNYELMSIMTEIISKDKKENR